MTIEEALTAYIKAQAPITAMIGTNPARFYFDDMPLGTVLPAIVSQCISDVKTHTHQGQTNTENPNYQLTAYGSTRANARALAEAIKTAFCDFSGTMSGVAINNIRLINELPDTLTSGDGTVKIHSVALEFQINYYKG